MAKKANRLSWDEKPAEQTATVTDAVSKEQRTYSYQDWGADVQARLITFAIKQIMGTRTSSVPPAEKITVMDEYDELFQADTWAKERASGGPTVGAHITLIMRRKEVTASIAQKVWRAQSDAFKESFMEANSEAIEAIKAESADDVDLEDMI